MRLERTLTDAIASLEEFPDRGYRIADTNIRQITVPFGRSRYVLRYLNLAEQETIVVIRIWHGRESRV